MNIAVVFEGQLDVGGGFQQQLSTILDLQKIEKHNITTFVFSPKNKRILIERGIHSQLVNYDIFDYLFRIIRRQQYQNRLYFTLGKKSALERTLDKDQIDLVYFLVPSVRAQYLLAHNYIYTVWDLCHRDEPEFPEVHYHHEFEAREKLYNGSLKKAIAVITDSEMGKQNAIRRYGIDEQRIHAISFQPSANASLSKSINIKEKYEIDGKYIFYPAQFWSHKNHVYIIDALASLKQKGIKLHSVFCGSDKGNLKYVLDYAKKSGVESQIKYIGFAPDSEIYSLYYQSLALVMPTYFGPTNIPPLEAFAIGTPVIYSDLKGFREQAGDAALYCDLINPDSLVNHLVQLMNDDQMRDSLILKGKKHLQELTGDGIVPKLLSIFDEYEVKMKCWKNT